MKDNVREKCNLGFLSKIKLERMDIFVNIECAILEAMIGYWSFIQVSWFLLLKQDTANRARVNLGCGCPHS